METAKKKKAGKGKQIDNKTREEIKRQKSEKINSNQIIRK